MEKLTTGDYKIFWGWVQGANVTHLVLNSMVKEISLFHLGKALEGTSVRTLELEENDIDNYRVKALTQGLENTLLTKLNLNKNKIDLKGIKILLEGLQGTPLTSLSVQDNQLSALGAEAFAMLKGTAIDSLDVCWNRLEGEGAFTLIQALKGTSVTHLDLGHNRINSEAIEAMALALRETAITTLQLGGNSLGPASAKHFAGLIGSSVATLSLCYNELGARGAQVLITALAGSAVNHLDLSGNKIDDDLEVDSVLMLAHTAITQLSLAQNQIGSRFVQALIRGLPACLVGLSLIGNPLEEAEVAALMQGLKSTQAKIPALENKPHKSLAIPQLTAESFRGLTSLCLGAHRINRDAASVLVQILRHSQITTLEAHLGIDAIKILGAGLKETALNALSLTYDGPRDKGACLLAQSLIGTPVLSFKLWNRCYGFRLSSRGISPEGVQRLLAFLAQTKVTTLSLKHNCLGSASAEALAQGLAATSLTRLDLSKNVIGSEAAAAIGLGLVRAKLSYLDLSDNKLGAKGAQALIEAMAGSSITAINLLSNNIDDQAAAQLSPAVANTYLIDVLLGFFNFSLAQALRANLQKLMFFPYWALRLGQLSEEQKAPFYNKPALSPQATAQEQLHYAAGILMEANEDVQYHILSYLPLMNARKIKALQLRAADERNVFQDLLPEPQNTAYMS